MPQQPFVLGASVNSCIRVAGSSVELVSFLKDEGDLFEQLEGSFYGLFF